MTVANALLSSFANTGAFDLVVRGGTVVNQLAVGMGSDRPIVKVDNTDAKRAKNRRYEIQVKI